MCKSGMCHGHSGDRRPRWQQSLCDRITVARALVILAEAGMRTAAASC